MLVIVISFCLLADPSRCQDVRSTYMESASRVTPHACMSVGQQRAIEWLEANPAWRVAKIGCKPYKPETDA